MRRVQRNHRESHTVLVDSVEKRKCLENVSSRILDHFLLSPEDSAISFLTLAENVCDERGRKKFAVLETKRGVEEAEIGRFAKALQENQDRNY